MNFSTVDHLCVKLFLLSIILLNVFLKWVFTVVEWENENSLSVVDERQFACVELKGGTTVDILTSTNKG